MVHNESLNLFHVLGSAELYHIYHDHNTKLFHTAWFKKIEESRKIKNIEN